MKILFAVSNENVSNKIVDSYQKKYGEAVSYKNVFYFNAIIREIHKDKTYDRIVISEDLEPFSNNNYDVIDKFILERLKEISYEISSQDKFIDVVVICTDRRTKAGYVLSKMYEYGIYNALVGTDRRIDNVCSLLYNPRTQQEAKEYYNIESQVDTSSVDDVSEQEVQNILIHYKRLGKNEDRYTDSFNNIAAQYTDKQLKIIIKCLPINVRAVLEAECPKYQELVTYAEETEEEKAQKAKLQEQRRIEQIENEKKLQQKIEKEKRETERNAQKENQLREKMQSRQPAQTPHPTASGIDLLDNKRKEQRMTGNVIIPTNMNIRNERKIYTDEELNNMAQQQRQQRTVPQQQVAQPQSNSFPELDQIDARAEQPVQQPASTLPGTNDWDADPFAKPANNQQSANTLPGLDDFDTVLQQPVQQPTSTLPGLDDLDTVPQQPVQQSQDTVQNLNNIDANIENSAPAQMQMEAVASQPEIPQEPKRGRGRPRKNPTEPPKPKGKRGRPRKNPLPEDQIEEQKMPAIDKFDNIPQINTPQPTESMAQTSDNINTEKDWNQDPFATQTNNQQPASTLPGTNGWDADPFATNNNDGITLSSSVVGAVASAQPDTNNDFNNAQPVQEEKVSSYTPEPEKIESMQKIEENRLYSTGSLNSVLTKDKKIVAFVGASKNGTSFLVNNLACLFSSIGVKTAILDMTQNKNSYYIYTNNDERLRNIAYTSIENLENGIAEGIQVDRNLNVYTAIPNDGKDYSNAESILSTLVQNESLVLIDCDLKTDLSYFANAQEIYIIQSMDILTIQPLTAFLRELKTKGILDQEKLRIVVNKELKVKSLTSKAIIGGMSFYNDPAMSYMTELFNKDKIRACSIPFDENVYSKYLEGIVNCQISINGYNKNFMNCLKMLGNMVYPLLSKQTYSSRNSAEANYGNNFSTEMNNTLNQMKNKY